MEEKINYTLPLESSTVGEMIRTFLSCQKCKEVSTKAKQLHCSHTICQGCAMEDRTRHVQSGQWMIRCVICSLMTTWYGQQLEGLQDNATMESMVKKNRKTSAKEGLMKPKKEQISTYGEDMTINVVSFTKEKAEIEKALQSAKRKIYLCQQETKQVKDYEKCVNEAKAKVRRHVKRSAESYIAAIRSHQAQIMEEIEEAFQKDYQPVKEARDAIEVQMQSLQLVTQCCSVASKVLKNGGAPLDLDKFKNMVWQTMKKTKAGKLPTKINITYKPKIYFKPNESQFESLAEKVGHLAMKKQAVKKSVSACRTGVAEILTRETAHSSDEEPIYDLPPELEVKYAKVNKDEIKEVEEQDESLYAQVPFYAEQVKENLGSNPAESPLTGSCQATCTPAPLAKTNPCENVPSISSLPPPPSLPTFLVKRAGAETIARATALVARRRRAINGEDSDSNHEELSTSDVDKEDSNLMPQL